MILQNSIVLKKPKAEKKLMKVTVLVKTNSKTESLELGPEGELIVRLRTPPIEGQANRRLVELISEYFQVPKSQIKLKSGHKSKKKLFEF